ncbi:MAG: flavin reductase family protein [Vicinamibacterales bacterium]|jgi:flavin reductase (DIM6/NTAB) family NADH-FMN oxidoreductase RutF|nr:hypothetical protein [Acidobacteriota bacterium]MDP7294449.1 flavin reductase family protein [Vicinamibacterales bacterium]MDP7473204.1 flavin reductase family protein [Vicinamibacterales bacterium]MDP7672917.1 flavin reductase family protein [Vicinamibacterales bacterium]HJO39743.1 flavin reductase family protein [Vicinamibacterales bacterium]
MDHSAKTPRRVFLGRALSGSALAWVVGGGAGGTAAEQRAELPRRRLAEPGPMLPPVPAIFMTVNGRPGDPEEISVTWTFVVNGEPPQVGIAVGDEHIARDLVAMHQEFVLNVPTAGLVHPFDVVDMNSSRVADKFAMAGLSRGTAAVVDAPTINESPIQLECRVLHTLRVPPERTIYVAEVVATSVHEGICDEAGRLNVNAARFFGMTAGSGEFYTLGRKVGHIGQSVGRSDIRY